jgi:hypothetical protein
MIPHTAAPGEIIYSEGFAGERLKTVCAGTPRTDGWLQANVQTRPALLRAVPVYVAQAAPSTRTTSAPLAVVKPIPICMSGASPRSHQKEHDSAAASSPRDDSR